MKKTIFHIFIVSIIGLAFGCNAPQSKINPAAKIKAADLSCTIDTSFASFKDSLFVLNTAFGLKGSQACHPSTDNSAPFTADIPLYQNRKMPYDTVFWFPTDSAVNLNSFSIDIKQNPGTAGNILVTVTPKPNYKPGTEVRISIIGVVAKP